MDMTPREYQQYVQRKMKKSPLGKDVCLAFLVGGAICALGQAVLDGWISLGLSEEDAGTATSCSLVALSSLLTGLNLYNKLARFGGAGTLVPITGFFQRSDLTGTGFQVRGIRYRYGGEDVHRGRAGHYLRDTGIGDLRRDPDAVEMIGGGKIAYLNRIPLVWRCLGEICASDSPFLKNGGG